MRYAYLITFSLKSLPTRIFSSTGSLFSFLREKSIKMNNIVTQRTRPITKNHVMRVRHRHWLLLTWSPHATRKVETEKEESLQKGIYRIVDLLGHEIRQDYNVQQTQRSSELPRQWSLGHNWAVLPHSRTTEHSSIQFVLVFVIVKYRSRTTEQSRFGKQVFYCSSVVHVIPLTKVVIQESVGSIHNF